MDDTMALKLYIYLDLKGSILKTSKSIFSSWGWCLWMTFSRVGSTAINVKQEKNGASIAILNCVPVLVLGSLRSRKKKAIRYLI
jgi:hypothetical protein